MSWAKKKKSDKRTKSGRQKEGEFYSKSQQERLDDLFEKGRGAFSEEQDVNEDNFTGTGRKVRIGALVIGVILFVGYLMSTSEDEGATQSSSSKKEFVKQNRPLLPDMRAVETKSLSPLPLPINGKTRSFAQGERPAPLKVNTKGSDHHLIKLTKPGSTEPVMYLFIRAGQSAEMEVPLGTFEVKWATGKEWYGYKKKFGESTAYGKANKLINFKQTATRVIGNEITLSPVRSGNLPSITISADEF